MLSELMEAEEVDALRLRFLAIFFPLGAVFSFGAAFFAAGEEALVPDDFLSPFDSNGSLWVAALFCLVVAAGDGPSAMVSTGPVAGVEVAEGVESRVSKPGRGVKGGGGRPSEARASGVVRPK